jgi:hypothetical protein
MSSKEEFLNHLNELKERPDRKQFEEGFFVKAFYSDNKHIDIFIPVKRKLKKIYFVLPDKKLAYIRGGVRTLRSLDSYFVENRASIFRLYQKLSEFIDFNNFLIIVENARKNMEEAIRKSKKLLDDTLAKYSDRLKEGVFDIDRSRMEGYLVKGKIKNYFIGKRHLGVYTFPQGDYLCIVDNHEGRMFTKTDKLVSRIYLLLNDEDLKGKVKTMEGHGMAMNFGGEFDEDEDIEQEWTH